MRGDDIDMRGKATPHDVGRPDLDRAYVQNERAGAKMRSDLIHHAFERCNRRCKDDDIAGRNLLHGGQGNTVHKCGLFQICGGIVSIEPEIRVQVTGDKLPECTKADNADFRMLISVARHGLTS